MALVYGHTVRQLSTEAEFAPILSQTLSRCHDNDFPALRWSNAPKCFCGALTSDTMIMSERGRGIFVPHIQEQRVDATVTGEQIRSVTVARTMLDLPYTGCLVRGA